MVREQGTILFAAVEARLPCERGALSLRGSLAGGDWDYSGVSSTGNALSTTSRRSSSEVMVTYSYAASPRLEPFFSAGVWSAKRVIRSAGPVAGYQEEYRLYPLSAGLHWRPAVLEDRLLLGARLGTALRPQVNVRLPGRDPLILNLGRTRSAGLSAEWTFGKQVLGQWVLTTSWEKTQMDASSPGVVTRAGVPTGTATQPRTELTKMQVSLMWRTLLD